MNHGRLLVPEPQPVPSLPHASHVKTSPHEAPEEPIDNVFVHVLGKSLGGEESAIAIIDQQFTS
jgi:hypothetical protein